ncbi:beta-ketoacyl-ACP synthase III [Streptomyces ficellus]|uniref:Beta-ketoacyl-[acyl-carrier-protein] synthase III n=1 Tax=Streptomyces ficellus TaxID=1977088 RepID=A0ABT7ZC30_9ACTN|nr:beta-ketoacyl-ACP synthase III [Streptomyces ficellus]MDN3297063.1 beta-ketoacyl-ACP synthase III [Streptomyces ficellus]
MSRSRAAVLSGLGSWLPPRVVTNEDLSRRFDTSDEWIRSRTGIAQRHVVDPGVATGDLAHEAGLRALKSAGTDSVDAVVLATTTPDHLSPATAPDVAARLGMGGTAAFDVAAVCSGFVYALATGAGLIASGIADSVLIIGAETFTTIVDPADRSTSSIFGDGAGAVVLRAGEPGEPGAVGPFDLGSDGSLAHLLVIPAGGARQRSSGREPEPGDTYFHMQGSQVYKHAVLRMTESARRVLAAAGLGAGDIDRFVGHQANLRILDSVAERLGIPLDHRVTNIADVGNTAAASIPLALADAAARGELRPGHRVLAGAFGGGLTWGSCLFQWPDITPV